MRKKSGNKLLSLLLALTLVLGMLPMTVQAATGTAPVRLDSLTPGDTVSFGGVTWIVVEPGNGLLLMKDYYSTYLGSIEISSFAFDSSGSTSYDPSSTTNIAYRLNNEFYNSLGSDSALIASTNWHIGPLGHESTPTVNCKIGMLSMSLANIYYTGYKNLGSISNDWWTLTPMDGGGVNLRTGNGAIGGSVDPTYSAMVRPALYLPPSTLVSGGTVLGGSHNIPAVTGISPVNGSSQGGTEVTVSGTGLSEVTEVYFGSTAGTITGASDTSITMTAPEGTGLVDITVTNPYGTSQTSSADQFQYIPTQATPIFSPAAGEVDFGTELQLISTGAEHIYYTTDGTDPSTSSTEYDDAARPVINSAMTVKAIATASGKEDSIVASASYTQAASADLTDIVVSGAPGNFIFTPDQYTYTGLTVASGVETVTVTPTGAGVITVNGTEVASGHASADIALTGGVEESITVAATETGKSPKAYSIKITRTQPMASITKNGVATNYDTLSAALADAHNDTITLLRDVTESVVLAATTVNTITIDGQGHTITGEEAGQSSVALTLSGGGNVILKSLTLQGGGAPNSDSTGLLVSGGSVNVLCEGTVNAYGVSNNSSVSSGLIHSGSGSVNITNATGGSSTQLASYGVQNTGAGTVNVANATAGSSDISYGVSYGVYNSGAGTVNVTNASSSSARQSVGVFNHGTGSVNVASASGGAATYYSFGVNNTQSGGSVNVANASMVPGGTYGNDINGVAVNMDVTTLKLNRGSGESCVLDTITIASAGSTTIGILPGVLKDGVVYGWYADSAKTNFFNGTTVTGMTNLYSGLPPVPDSVIDISAISGVTVPVAGETPVSSIADTAEYTATISWSPATSVFASDTVYTATITITPKDGYTLNGVGGNFFSVPGAATTNPAESGVVTAVFPRTEITIASLAADINAVPGLTATVNGSTVTVTGTATVTTTSDAALTINIPEGVKVVWKASLTGGGSKYLLEPTGDGTFEVADGANIVNDAGQEAIYCYGGKGSLLVTGGNVSTTKENSMAIGIAGGWLLTMTGGTVSANAANSCAIFGKNPVVITGGTVSATDASGYQLYMGGTSVYRSGVLDPGKIMYHNKGVFADVCVGALVTQAVSGTSIGLTVTEHNLSTGDSVEAVWAKQNGESGVIVSYYSDNYDTEFLAVPGVTVADTGSPTDSIPPTVTSVTPGGIGGAINGNIAITFSEPMNTVSGAVYLSSDGGGSYGSALTGGSWSVSDSVYTVPYSGLSYSKTYSIKAEGFKDTAGNVMSVDTSHSFATMAGSTLATYTVTFDLAGGTRTGGGELTQTVTQGSAAMAPTVTRSGYTFSGWNKEFNNVTSNLTVKANWSYNGSGDNNGGGGGGSYTPPTPPASNVVTEKQPNMPTTAKMSVPGTVKDGVLSATITEQMAKDAIKAAQDAAKKSDKEVDGIALDFNVTGSGSQDAWPSSAGTARPGYTNLNATIDAGAIDRLKEAGVKFAKIGSAVLDITLDAGAIVKIDNQSTGMVTVSAARLTKLSGAAKKLIGSRPVFDITVSYQKNGKTENVTNFGKGAVTLGIAYKAANNENTGNLFGVYVDKNGKPQLLTNSSYGNGRVIFSRNSLSTYGVGYKAPAPAFTDTAKHWAKDNIDFVASRDLISGTSATTFAPNTAITRADFLMALGRLSGADVSIYKTSSFTDVKSTDTAMPYIEWAVGCKIVSGYGNGKFGPTDLITREQMAVMMQNYAKATGYKLPASVAAVTFSDIAKISAYAKEAVKAIQQAGIMQGKGSNTFDPQGNATRGEASTILRRFVELVIDEGTARGWVQNDAGQWQYIGENGNAVTGWFSVETAKYYFTSDGIMASGKWLEIDGKWYYFNADGSLAKNAKVDGYEVDENGVRKTK